MAKNNEKSVLKSWFVKQPLKFAVLAVVSMIFVTGIYSFINTFAFDAPLNSAVIAILMLACAVFAGYKLIKGLPSDNLDRRSFVAIDNGLTMAIFGTLIVMSAFLISNMQRVTIYMLWLQSTSILLFFAIATIVAMIYMYIIGILVANGYATYRRAIGMGVARWKALLSLPFALTLLWFPGFFLNDDKAKPVLAIKTKWYSDFTDWVIAKPLNAVAVFAFSILLTFVFMDLYSSCVLILGGAYFGIWALVMGAKKLRHNIGGLYSSVAVVINLILIIFLITSVVFFKPNTAVENIQIETIEIADTQQ